MKYVCDVCGWEYDESIGDPDNVAPGTSSACPPILNALCESVRYVLKAE